MASDISILLLITIIGFQYLWLSRNKKNLFSAGLGRWRAPAPPLGAGELPVKALTIRLENRPEDGLRATAAQ